ncbi:hypothetical protein ElyMa_007041500 [Elysia marginata]|uniref:Uncharacterized protein n=1 Tax=Elysia marginata TaxID=1093978 RepID=A0AAV4JTD7_9GAST|nr:hypothetical protein ElyMa_007041500 [Elysia marginata]
MKWSKKQHHRSHATICRFACHNHLGLPPQWLVKSNDWFRVVTHRIFDDKTQSRIQEGHVTWIYVHHWQEKNTRNTRIVAFVNSLHHSRPVVV